MFYIIIDIKSYFRGKNNSLASWSVQEFDILLPIYICLQYFCRLKGERVQKNHWVEGGFNDQNETAWKLKHLESNSAHESQKNI